MRTLALWMTLLTLGCNGGTTDVDPGTAKEGDDCTSLMDCEGELACLSIGEGTGTCVLQCDLSVDACGAEAQCGSVGSVGVDVCQPPESVVDPQDPPEEEERASFPCSTDEECEVLAPNAVCGTWRGWSECTTECTSADTCNPPPIGGVTTTFLACDPDEADAARNICVPNEDCFSNPMSCVDFGMPF